MIVGADESALRCEEALRFIREMGVTVDEDECRDVLCVVDLFHCSNPYEYNGTESGGDDEHNHAVAPATGLANTWLRVADEMLRLDDCTRAETAIREAQRIYKAAGDEVGLGRVHGRYGQLFLKREVYEQSLLHCNIGFSLLRGGCEHEEVAELQMCAGVVQLRLGDYKTALRTVEDSLSTFRRIGDEIGIGRAYNNLGIVHRYLGNWHWAEECLREGVRRAQSSGDDRLQAGRLLNLGIVLLWAGKRPEAFSCLRQSLDLSQRLGHQATTCRALLALGRAECMMRNWSQASHLLRSGLRLARALKLMREEIVGLECLGEMLLSRGKPARAIILFEEGLRMALAVGPHCDHVCEIRRRSAEAKLRLGDLEGCTQDARAALQASEASGDRREAALARLTLGEVAFSRGRDEEGTTIYRESIEELAKIRDEFERGRAMLRFARHILGRAEAQNGSGDPDDLREAKSLLVTSRQLFERCGAPFEHGSTLAELGFVNIRLQLMDQAAQDLDAAERLLMPFREPAILARLEEIRMKLQEEIVRKATSAGTESNVLRSLATSACSGCGTTELLAEVRSATRADRAMLFVSSEDSLEVVTCDGLVEEDARQLVQTMGKSWPELGSGARPFILNAHPDPNGLTAAALTGEEKVSTCLLVPSIDGENHEGSEGHLYLDRIGEQEALGEREMRVAWLALPLILRALRREGSYAELPSASGEEALSKLGIVTVDPKMVEILEISRRVAKSTVPVLIEGETGTGKGLIAQALHTLSGRPGSLVAQNCGALPRELLEALVFGHDRGAFTGAHTSRSGLFEAADRGTLFLDEVGELHPDLQVKMLRVLEDRVCRRLGETRDRSVDVRVLSATNRDLRGMIQEGSFRMDFYHRLKGISIRVPPLRERPGDVLLLVDRFLKKHSSDRPVTPRMTKGVLELFLEYSWPGNVRELENEIQRLLVLCQGDEIAEDLILKGDSPFRSHEAFSVSWNLPKGVPGRTVLLAALRGSAGNVTKAASRLEISRQHLYRKIREHNIDLQTLRGSV